MKDYKTIKQLRKEHSNLDNYILFLCDVIKELETRDIENNKYTARINPPTKTYKELEEKLANFETEKQQEISEILNEKIVPLNREVQELRADNYNLKTRNIVLEETIKKLDIIITLAAGYISSTAQINNDHPMNVKRWLMGGME